MSGTGGLFSHFAYYHARELPAPPFLPRPFRVEFVVAVAAHLAPRGDHGDRFLIPLAIKGNFFRFYDIK